MDIIIGNSINFIGVAMLLISHTIISLKNSQSAFLFGFFGGLFIATGSWFLGSYPIITLNIFWAFISLLGYYELDPTKNMTFLKRVNVNYIIVLVSIMLFWLLGQSFETLAYITTFIYLMAYFAFSTNTLKKLDYLVWCSFGFLMLIPHLVDKNHFSVSINEIYGFVIGLIGINKILKENKESKKEKV